MKNRLHNLLVFHYPFYDLSVAHLAIRGEQHFALSRENEQESEKDRERTYDSAYEEERIEFSHGFPPPFSSSSR